MRDNEPFGASDLEDLDARLLSRASAVVPMRDVAAGARADDVIGLRHDVDDNPGALDTALRLASWERERGYSATYYLLHDAHYWPYVQEAASEIEHLGHEVGLHVNGISEGLRQRRDPHEIVAEALATLREVATVTGCVAHGDPLCHTSRFVNDELFTESPRPAYGAPDRILAYQGYELPLEPRPRTDIGLVYDANWLSRGDYLSDSGGRWSQPFDIVANQWPGRGQLHVLVHPDWWAQAFAIEQVAA